MVIRSSFGSKGAWKGHEALSISLAGWGNDIQPQERDGRSHRSRQGKPLKPTQLHFPGLSLPARSHCTLMLLRPFQVKLQFQVFSHTEVPWFLFFFFSFFLIKKLVFFLPGKIGCLASLPTAGETFHCDFPFLSSPLWT